MKKLRWPTNADAHAYMRDRQSQNLARAIKNQNENWMADKLSGTKYKWTRQAQWGYRVFDFWCHELGVAVEVDGEEHRIEYDNYRDEYNYRRSGVLVLHVRNMNEEDAAAALGVILNTAETWAARRERLGISGNKKARRHLVSGQGDILKDES